MLRSLLAILLRQDAIALDDPLAKLTAEVVDVKMLKDVATKTESPSMKMVLVIMALRWDTSAGAVNFLSVSAAS